MTGMAQCCGYISKKPIKTYAYETCAYRNLCLYGAYIVVEGDSQQVAVQSQQVIIHVKVAKCQGKVEQVKGGQEQQGEDTISNGLKSITEKAELSHEFCDSSFLTIQCHYVITQIKNCFSGVMKKLRIPITS